MPPTTHPEHMPTTTAAPVELADVSAAETATLLAAVADELHLLAHSLGSIGYQAIGLHLHAAASAVDRALPAQEGWWTSAFNGQEGRSRLFLRLLDMLRPIAVVETGTFRGTTTAFIASHFAGRVLTCEVDPRWYLTALANLAPYPNVELHQTDSRAFLRALLAELPAGPLIYYLDAHWQGDLPLREEIELILSHGQPAAIMIDDFAVPSDKDYRYDDYGPGKTLSVELLAGIAPRGAMLFFPTLPASEETGARRGCAVIGVGSMATTLLAGLAELQPHDWPGADDEVAKPTQAPPPDQAAALAPLQLLITARDVAAERDALRARMQAAQDEVERFRGEAAAHQASISWRITRPLRCIRRLFS
jgi:hypothetical protein